MKKPVQLVIIIVCSFLLAIVLSLLPLPRWANWFRPLWELMVVIYWILNLPYKISIGMAWLVGFLLDLLTNSPLGMHALAFTCIGYLTRKFQFRISLFNIVHKTYVVFILVLIYQSINFITYGLIGDMPNTVLYWMPALTSALLWPWTALFLNECWDKEQSN